jgi:threonine dehydrogenase-like Zn-dependent dehydrogenase
VKAVVYKGPYSVVLNEVPMPSIEQPVGAIVRITHEMKLADVPTGYDNFDERVHGSAKVLLRP